MVGYVGSYTGSIVTGNTIQASHFTTEFGALVDAFHISTGHNHDGTAGGGAPIPLGGVAVTGTLPVTKGGTGLIIGTSGGIPYFSSTTALTSSALLTANAIILGGGAGATPVSLASLGTTSTVLHGNASGAPTFGAIVTADITNSNVTYAKIQDVSATDKLLGRSTSGAGVVEEITCTSYARTILDDADAATARTTLDILESFIVALSDETTDITTGTAKITFRMPYAFTLTAVRASLSTVSSSGIPTVNIKESGTTIFSTKLTIDANEKTSTTAAIPYVLSDTSLADDAEITMDIDVAGTGARGLKVYLIGRRT